MFVFKVLCIFFDAVLHAKMLSFKNRVWYLLSKKKLFEVLKICTQRLKPNHLELESIFSTFFLFLNAFHVFQILLSCVKTRKGKENFQGWLLRLFEKTNWIWHANDFLKTTWIFHFPSFSKKNLKSSEFTFTPLWLCTVQFLNPILHCRHC